MSETEEIKSRLNIVDIVGDYVKLSPAGANQKGLCPFHNEKTSSFMVNEERQIFHCFGCGKGGDVFTFIQEIEGMEFVDALKLLADKAGVELKKTLNKEKVERKNKARDALKHSVLMFNKYLTSSKGIKAYKYLADRGVTDNLIEKFALGLSPDGWRKLMDKLLKADYTKNDLIEAGLIVESQKKPNNFYDRFRERIMFPIFSPMGEPLGFSARILPDDDSEMGKYINTPQTSIYDKSKTLYGIHLAKQAIKQKDLCIILEGNLDVVMSHKAEIENVVASCGTAITKEQLQIIGRYSKNVVFAFDLDEAGIEAAKKGIDLALSI
jgi:DNA primase